MSTVFLSYCSKDHFFAQLAQHKLEKERIKVWLDGHQLRAGDDWRQEIDRGIADSYAVIVALSAASARSHYVTYEWASAIGKDKPIVPVLLEACDRHPRIEPIQYLDFTNAAHQPWKQLVERLKEIESEREIPASEEQVEALPTGPTCRSGSRSGKPRRPSGFSAISTVGAIRWSASSEFDRESTVRTMIGSWTR
jgi:hypothetical protein